MKMVRRRILAVALLLAAAVGGLGGLLLAGTANAQQVTTGSLSFSGDSGDYISGGKSYSYDTSKGDALDVSSGNGSTFSLRITGYNGDWWTLDLDAPGSPDRPVPGQSAVLVPGTYSAAHRYPFNGTGPGLDLSGNGRGCNELTGSFTITKAVFVGSFVQSFDATFEQHCENGTTAARGQVHIANGPPPPGTAATSTRAAPTSPRATATGKPTASGTGSTAASPPATPTTGRSGNTLAGPGNANANDIDANPETASAVVREAFRTPLLMIGVGLVAWVVSAAVGLGVVGLVLAVRRR
jgi:hypothetical protein